VLSVPGSVFYMSIVLAKNSIEKNKNQNNKRKTWWC